MAGLFDLVNDPAILLGAGLLGAPNVGAGLQRGLGLLSDAQQQQVKNSLLQAQLENYRSEVETRKAALAKQDAMQKLLSDAFGGSSQGAQSAQTPVQAPSFGPQGLLGTSGAASMPSLSAAAATPSAGPNSRIGSMSPDMLALLKANGLDLVDVAKLARPDMQVTNGYAYDKNNTRPGFLPQLNVSQNGQASVVTLGPDGMPQVAPASGAVNAYSAFEDAAQRAKARYDVQPTFNQTTKQPELRSRLEVLGGQNPALPPAQQGVTGNFQGDPAAIMSAIIDIKDPQERANAMAAFTEQARRTQGFAAGQPFASGPSQADEANKVKLEGLARGDAERANENANKGQQFKDFRDQLGLARTLLQADPTHSVPGAIADTALGSVGYATSGSKVAKQLDLVGAWMTQNIPKAPGAQSNYELQQYQAAAGQVGNKMIPIEQRVAALDSLEKLINTWESRRAAANGGAAPASPGAGWSIREKK